MKRLYSPRNNHLPPMKERISKLLAREHTSERKRRNSLQRTAQQEAVIENARLNSQTPSCLTRLMQQFPLLHPLLQEEDMLPPSSPSHAPQQSLPVSSPGEKEPDPATLQRLKEVYAAYSPVHQQTEEMERIVSSLRRVAMGRPQNYIQSVHAEYVKLGGRRSLGDLQEKLQADLIFLIRSDNERPQYEARKYY